MKKIIAMLILCSLVLAGCGGKSAEATPTQTEPTTQPTETTEPVIPVPGHDQLLLYVRGNDLLLLDCETDTAKVICTHQDAWTAARLCDTRNSAASLSDDGGVVYWLMGGGENPDLYCYYEGGQSQQVARDVLDFRTSTDGRYCIFVNGQRQIYQYDLQTGTQTLISAWCSNEFSVDTWFFAVGGCPDSYLYVLENFVYFSDGLKLFRIAFGGNREKIAEQTWGFDRNYIAGNDLLCYIEYIQEQPLGSVYRWRNGDATYCVNQASYILQVYPDGSFYYIRGGGVSEEPPALCHFDGIKSTELLTFSGRYDFCFSTQSQVGMFFAYEKDLVYLVQGQTTTQWKENYVNRMYATGDQIWFSSASGVYRFDAQTEPVMELKDCKIYYQDITGRLICCSWKDQVYVDGLSVGHQTSSDSLFYRNDYRVTFETGHALVGFRTEGIPSPMTSYKNSYTFSLLEGQSLVEVADNTVTHFAMENGAVVYLKDMDKETCTGDLYLYQNGQTVKLDSQVYGIIPCTK